MNTHTIKLLVVCQTNTRLFTPPVIINKEVLFLYKTKNPNGDRKLKY